MYHSVVVFGEKPEVRLAPFYQRSVNIGTALCVKGNAFYDSLELLREDYHHIQDKQISFKVPEGRWISWEIGGHHSGSLKVFNDKNGYIQNKTKHGYLDQTTVGNLDLSEQGFVPDAYLLKGVWVDIPDTFFIASDPKNADLPFKVWQNWRRVVLALPKNTLVTLVVWHDWHD